MRALLALLMGCVPTKKKDFDDIKPPPKGAKSAKRGAGTVPQAVEQAAPAVDKKNAALIARAAKKVAKKNKAEPLELMEEGDEFYGKILQEDDELWRDYGGTVFDSVLQVDTQHGVSPVRLIDMRFIIALGELGGTMVRRQDLPEEAFLDFDTVKRLCHHADLRIISISHPWQQPDHPDPKEVNLQLLAKVFKIMLQRYKEWLGLGTFAVFFE